MSTNYPRGSGGCVLYPGSVVLIHDLIKAHDLNGKEGTVESWDPAEGRLHVRIGGDMGSVRALKAANLKKLMVTKKLDPQAERIKDMFRHYDENGDGVLHKGEMTRVMSDLKVNSRCIDAFLRAVDKDGDGEISYEEFVEWMMSKDSADAENKHGRKPMPFVPRGGPQVAPDEGVAALQHQKAITLDDLARVASLPNSWPQHGITVLNNMHARFPDYEIDSIVFMMIKHKYHGGKVLKAIRDTGTREVEMANYSTDVSTDARGERGQPLFPAEYEVRFSAHKIKVYTEFNGRFSFALLRDEKLNPVGQLDAGDRFKVTQVRIGAAYGFAFGKIEYGATRALRERTYWVNLGLPTMDWSYTEAERKSLL
eukprot:TRINITY_DN17402_c0_g1_i2.p1 TRINITY_DN17402_c0_g1~~TRINITY_DN17402_c0_g1_i2.p1  ORF type:complete len:368 (-),score=57.71 TRINITY_DN17402_c0_g1_i2:251-1354(-)